MQPLRFSCDTPDQGISASKDISSKNIDWNAVFTDTWHMRDTEPAPPLRRSIYNLIVQPGWKVRMHPYDSAWPEQFVQIRSHIANLLATSSPPAHFTSIEHIGSTSIPGLCAKANIDILITFPSSSEVSNALEAFDWEIPTTPPFIKYTRVPRGGGFRGRESLKLYVPDTSPYYVSTPERSVYLINEGPDNEAGKVHIRCYRDVKKTLCDPVNHDLLSEYARVKMELAELVLPDSISYSTLKNDVIRKILLRAGWTDEEVDVKENLSQPRMLLDEPPY